MRFEAILFDCDGVLMDSEPLTLGVLRDMLEVRGWTLSLAQCMEVFTGKAIRDERAVIEANTGQAFSEDWLQEFFVRRNQVLLAQVEMVVGARDAVQAAHAYTDSRIACASGADRAKTEMQLRKVGLMPFFDGRVFSGHEMARTKPAPDVYLAAAHHLQAAPERCLVIEDSVVGVTAAVAAGATVWAYCPNPAHAAALGEAGAHRQFPRMTELSGLLGQT